MMVQVPRSCPYHWEDHGRRLSASIRSVTFAVTFSAVGIRLAFAFAGIVLDCWIFRIGE